MKIESVTEADAQALLSVYAPYVEHTAVTFEYEVPSPEEFSARILQITAAYPYLKAVDENGAVLGYAYAGRFHPRKAYDWSAEVTVYIRQDMHRRGIGRALYESLEEKLRTMGVCNLNACIAVPREENGEDAHLTLASPRFHARMGYAPVGTFHCSGYKFHTWYDMVWMEKLIGEHGPEMEPVRFGQYEKE